jgi:phosphoglycerate kinase
LIDEAILTLDDISVEGKTVLLRVDINSPVDESRRIKDRTRILRCLPTIRELHDKGAKLVVLAHQADPIEYQNFTVLEEHADILSELLGSRVEYVDDVAGPFAIDKIRAMQPGDILLLDNVRIYTEETIIFEKEVKLPPEDQARTTVVRRLSPLTDYYVCDAFAAVHRSQPTLVGFPELLPSAAGRLFEEELRTLSKIKQNPKRPCIFILGGAKILDAFRMMRAALEDGSADKILTTGLVAQIMLKAMGNGLGRASEAYLENKNLLEFVPAAEESLKSHADRIVCPEDFAVDAAGQRKELEADALPDEQPIADIGERTIQRYCKLIAEAKTVFVNGPAGVYEKTPFALGTRRIWEAVAASAAFSVLGGGDSIAAAKLFGLEEQMSFISTAGGGLIRFLAGEKLAVVEALEKSAERFGGKVRPQNPINR